MAIYSLHHSTVGRTTHAPGTAGAHIKYITRASACRAIITEHFPKTPPGSKGGAAAAWICEQEASDRKNARVIDKVMLALPRELDEEQRVQAVRSFVAELAQNQPVPFLAAVHDKAGTKDAENPHVHIVIRDRSPETGKGRVIGLSEKGSTSRARVVWQRVCNEALKAAGFAVRVDHRSLRAQGITDRKAQGHEGPTIRQMENRGLETEKGMRLRAQNLTDALPQSDGGEDDTLQQIHLHL